MNIFRKIVAGIGAVLLTATLMGLPDLSMAQVPGAATAGVQIAHVLHRSTQV
jgi:hypothetical protein